jgi:hypothetical protein
VRAHERHGRTTCIAAVLAVAAGSGCGLPNHHLVHPETQPAGLVTWTEDVTHGDLLIHLEGAVPPGPGPFPAVLVHPEGGKTARDMSGGVAVSHLENGP